MAQNPSLEASPRAVEPHPETVETSAPSKLPAKSGPWASSLATLTRRRHFLIDSRSQLRAGFLSAAAAMVLLLLLNVSLYSSRKQVTETVLAESPELGQVLHAQNRVEMALVVTASIVFLAGVFVVTVLETHKTAGAAFNVARHMAEVQQGVYSSRIRLRKDDNLRILERAFNDMSRSLQERAWRQVVELEHLAVMAENLAGPDEARALANELRSQAEQRRRLAG